MVDISSGDKKINITVTSSGNKGNIATSPDMSMFYTERSREWAISDKLVNNEDYSSKYYAQKSKEQAQISTEKTEEVVNSGNEVLSNIDNAKTGALTDIETNKANAITDIVSQVNLAKEQATIATEQASIATNKTSEVVESGNTALNNISNAKTEALNEINTTGARYVENAEQYAQNSLTSANNAALSENNALSYKNSALESSQTATAQANISVSKSNEASESAIKAKTSETNAKSSETRCEEILSRLGTAIKIKGRVDSIGDLPLGDNLDGDTYLVGTEGLDSYPEYYWYQDHWEFLGTSGGGGTWGTITGDITAQSDLMDKLNTKQNVLTAGSGIRISGNTISNAFTTLDSYTTFSSDILNNEQSFIYKSATGEYKRGNFINFVNSIIKPTFAAKTDLSTVAEALNGKSDTGHTHTAAEVGAIANKNGVITAELVTDGSFGTIKLNNGSQNYYVPRILVAHTAGGSEVYATSSPNGRVDIPNIFTQLGAAKQSDLDALSESKMDKDILNNPYSFGDSKYSPIELNNISWLASNGQWNAKATYPDYYAWILENVNNGVGGFKLSTDTYDDYSWVINTSDETFRLPLLNGSEEIADTTYSINTNTSNISITTTAQNIFKAPKNGICYFILQQTSANTTTFWINNKIVASVGFNSEIYTRKTITIPVKRGDNISAKVDQYNSLLVPSYFNGNIGNGSLYYYVGETVQNANLIDAGRIGESLATKTDKVQAAQASMPSDKYIDLTLGASGTTYTAPANGFITLCKTANGNQYVTLRNATNGLFVFSSGISNNWVACTIPCKKSESIYVEYNTGGTTNIFRFIYAQGESEV